MLTGLVDQQCWVPLGLLGSDSITRAYIPLVYHAFDGRVPCPIAHLRLRPMFVRGGLGAVDVGVTENIGAA